MNEQTAHLSTAYAARLAADYGPDISSALQYDWRQAPLPQQLDERIEYVRLGEPEEGLPAKPVLYVNGFAGGIAVNAPFVAAMASRQFDIILPDQNHASLPRLWGDIDATYGQARNIAAIITHEGLEHTPLNVVTHSYGSLVFDELTHLAGRAGWTCFQGANVAMLAPAGVKQDERLPSFLKRYVALLRGNPNMEKFTDGYWDFEGEMFEANKQHVLANKRRTLYEARDIIWRRINVEEHLAHGVGKIALIPFAEDSLFSEDALAASIAVLVSSRVTAFSPISLQNHGRGLRSGRGADHADHQFNPERVAGAVAQFLRAA